MAKNPSGNRPVPRVAKGKSPSFNTSPTNSLPSTRGTKTPTGNRPVPGVPRNIPTAPTVGQKRKSKPAVPHRSMPAPKTQATTGKSRANGGSGN